MLIGSISKVVRAPTNGATLPLLTSCIAASEKFEVNAISLNGKLAHDNKILNTRGNLIDDVPRFIHRCSWMT